MDCQGYAPTVVAVEQDGVLDRIEAQARPGAVAVLDLDGCLFDNRPRQVAIIHEYAAHRDVPALSAVGAEHFADWDARRTLRNAGVDPVLVDAVYADLRAFWWQRFFSSDYVRLDLPMPGAVRLARRLQQGGCHLVYLTGRDHTMHPGTAETLRRYGFPDPDGPHGADGPGATLLTKPEVAMSDEDWKALALPRLQALGEPVVFLDNEPTNVNLFADAHPGALVVFVSTDHSPRPTRPHAHLPWIRGFLRTTDAVPGQVRVERIQPVEQR